MKKLSLGLLTTGLMALSLTACSQGSTADNQPNLATNGGNQSAAEAGADASSGKKTIVYQTWRAKDGLKDNIQKYESLHPNIEIKLETPPELDWQNDPESSSKYDQYSKNLDASIMAGKGPDMFEADLVPTKYVNHHIFADLEEMINQDSSFKKEDYSSNIIDGVRESNGALYSMPLGYFLITYAGDKKAIDKAGVKIDDTSWTWKDFMNISQQLLSSKGEHSAIITDSPTNLISNIISSNESLVMDRLGKKAHFDSPEFKDLLNQLKTMKDKGYLSSDLNSTYFNFLQMIGDAANYIDNSKAPNGHLYTYPHPDGVSGGYFSVNTNVSIADNSKVKPEAWDFLKFMMAEEAETASIDPNVEGVGIPINKQAFAKQLDLLKQAGSFKTYEIAPGTNPPAMTEKDKKVDPALVDEFEKRAQEATLQYEQDSFIVELCRQELDAFFSGQKSLDAVVKVLQDKTTTYLNE